jgi:cystathionine beta-lyase
LTNPQTNQPIDFETIIPRENTGCVKYDARVARFGRADVRPLWVADMDFAAPDCVRHALAERVAHPIYGYSIYSEEFFSAIINWQHARHGWQVSRAAIVPLPGIVPALNLLIRALTQPGDGVLVQTPVYPPIHQLPSNSERVLLENALIQTPQGALIDWPDFETKIAQARVFVLCSPHNPVGRVWRLDELNRIAELCARFDVIVLVDEVHADIVFTPHRHIPFASLPAAQNLRCITLNAPSKTFNIAGLNTAYAIVAHPTLRAKLTQTLEAAGLSSGNCFGITALIAAYQNGAPWLDQLRLSLQRNRDFAVAFFKQNNQGITVAEPQASFLLWLDCHALMAKKNLPNDDALADFFIRKAGLGLNPGLSFGAPGAGFMRLNIGCPHSVLKTALEQLNQAASEDS